jgi:hypothetical protein
MVGPSALSIFPILELLGCVSVTSLAFLTLP